MSITSFYFLCFYVVLLILYYLVPGKGQHLVLLGGSVTYYLFSGQGILLFYPILSGSICYVAGKIIQRGQGRVSVNINMKRAGLLLALVGCLGSLFFLKYSNFLISIVNGISGSVIFDTMDLLVPLGISYYTFTMLGYVIDLYYGIGKESLHLFHFLSFGIYFPTLISGPIMNYQELAEKWKFPHKFQYKQVTFGLQRMLWGFFKKLVISERLALVVNTVFNGYEEYRGGYFWTAAVFFVLQLYTDFSGCMDIVLGISETLGLKLPENFNTPFFSRSIAEFWRRWHMTLGGWMKNYVFYPVLRSKVFVSIGKKLRKVLGKKTGKNMTTYIAMFILWFIVGIWHGPDWKFVIGSGLIHWIYIILEELLRPHIRKFRNKLGWKEESRIYVWFQRLETFLLIAIAFVFFRAEDVKAALYMLKSMFSTWNPVAVFGTGFFSMGLDWIEMIIAIVSLGILFVVSLLKEKGISVRESISGKKLPVRWCIWYALLFYTILLGYYGPEYSAAEFIYQGF